jgi:Tetratricopeptide repeat
MKPQPIGLLIAGLLALTGAPSAAADITQTTGAGSWCSPAQNGNGNAVVCNGVDPRAMDRLNELLDRKDLDLKQKTAEANDWARRYSELNAQLEETKKQLAAKGEDATLVQTAQDLLHEGKLEEAHAIFDRLLQSDEANVDRAAQDHFGRASVFALQFRLDEALPDYAKAYQYRPDDQRYVEAYAFALQEQRDYPDAEAVLQDLLKQRRSEAAQDPAAYPPDLAATLNNLGNLYDDTHRFAEAEATLKEAADIRRALAAQNPAAYRPDLAQTLNNLGALYGETHRFAEAEVALRETADIQRTLAAQNPAAYRPNLAAMLNNLGYLYGTARRFADAEAALKGAADIERELATQNPPSTDPTSLGHSATWPFCIGICTAIARRKRRRPKRWPLRNRRVNLSRRSKAGGEFAGDGESSKPATGVAKRPWFDFQNA